jgi:DNA ligase (NAD+)
MVGMSGPHHRRSFLRDATALALASHFGSLENLMQADEQALLQVEDVGPVMAAHIAHFFGNEENHLVIEQLRARGVRWPEHQSEAVSDKLAGQIFVLTGTLETMTRDDARRVHALIERHAELTGSTRAQAILARWEHYLPSTSPSDSTSLLVRG